MRGHHYAEWEDTSSAGRRIRATLVGVLHFNHGRGFMPFPVTITSHARRFVARRSMRSISAARANRKTASSTQALAGATGG